MYYITAIPFVGIADGSLLADVPLPFARGALASLYALRLWSSLMALITVAAVYLTVRTLFDNVALALGTAAFTALTPGFVLSSSSANNDNAVIMFSALSILCMVRAAREPSLLMTLAATVTMSAALFSKIIGLFLVPLFVFLILGQVLRQRNMRHMLRTAIPFGLAAIAALALWLSSSNWGTASRIMALTAGYSALSPQNLGWVFTGLRDGQVYGVFWNLLTSYWGFSGWQTYTPLPAPVAVLAVTIAGLGLGGSLQFIVRRQGVQSRLGLAICCVTLLELLLISIFSQLGKPGTTLGGAAHSRYLFPAIAAASLIQFAGTLHLVPRRARLGAGVALLAAIALLHVSPSFSAPRYYSGPISVEQSSALHARTGDEVVFANGAQASLRISAARLQAGDVLVADLLWHNNRAQKLDFTSFLHLVGADGQAIAKNDQVPTVHRFPPRLWRPGDVIQDQRDLMIPVDAGPGAYEVQLGSYLNKTGETIPIERPVGQENRAIAAKLIVEPPSIKQPAEATPLEARFGEAIVLQAASPWIASRTGSQREITLYWQATADTIPDYAVSIQVLDGAGRLVTQSDGPLGGAYHTGLWRSSQLITEAYSVTLPANASGRFQIAVAVYDGVSMRRLPVVVGSRRIDGDLLGLAHITLP